MIRAASACAPTVTPASEGDFGLLERLLQLYLHDFSAHTGDDVDDGGSYRYAWLENYRHEAGRHAYLFRVEGHPAGFALVRSGESTQMAEFFVLRKYRRGGVGTAVARQLFSAFPGPWTLSQLPGNHSATEFWHRAIPGPFEEIAHADGRVEQRFVSPL